MKFDEFCRMVESRLKSAGGPEEKLSTAAEALKALFRVRPDEISIFSFDPHLQVLRFVWPRHLRRAGLIPLGARQSLVSRTFLENRPLLNNNFARASHLVVFEMVSAKQGEAPHPIQKIISAPMGQEGGFRGVVQVCRKGEAREKAGPDFSQTDLSALAKFAGILAEQLHPEGTDEPETGGACGS